MIELDIVIPVYNSGKIIGELIERLNQWQAQIDFKFRVLFVDDGSIDESTRVIKEAHKDFSFKCIRLAKNYGQHTATAVGLSHATAPHIATIDDDLQHDPSEISKLFLKMNEVDADLVVGTFAVKKHSYIRNLGSFFLKKMFLMEGFDYANVTSFRLMKNTVAQVFKNVHTPILFIEEFLLKGATNRASCEVSHHKRFDGKSNYSNWKLFKFALNIIIFHTSLPLKFIIRFGLMMAVFFFLSGCYFIYNKVVNDVQLGYTSLIVAIFFSTGMMLMSLGIIGEYIRKIWIAQNNLDKIIQIEA
jgi:glycosyltransferase involved in cell wall biosynthesis